MHDHLVQKVGEWPEAGRAECFKQIVLPLLSKGSTKTAKAIFGILPSCFAKVAELAPFLHDVACAAVLAAVKVGANAEAGAASTTTTLAVEDAARGLVLKWEMPANLRSDVLDNALWVLRSIKGRSSVPLLKKLAAMASACASAAAQSGDEDDAWAQMQAASLAHKTLATAGEEVVRAIRFELWREMVGDDEDGRGGRGRGRAGDDKEEEEDGNAEDASAEAKAKAKAAAAQAREAASLIREKWAHSPKMLRAAFTLELRVATPASIVQTLVEQLRWLTASPERMTLFAGLTDALDDRMEDTRVRKGPTDVWLQRLVDGLSTVPADLCTVYGQILAQRLTSSWQGGSDEQRRACLPLLRKSLVPLAWGNVVENALRGEELGNEDEDEGSEGSEGSRRSSDAGSDRSGVSYSESEEY